MKTKLNWNSFEANASENGESNASWFESLCRQLFVNEFIEEESQQRYLQSTVNNPGIEAEPVLAKGRDVKIGFQAKYFSNRSRYDEIWDSGQKAVKFYKGKMDELILFCNLPPSPRSKIFKKTEAYLQENGITLVPIAGNTLLDRIREYEKLCKYITLGKS